MQYNPISENLKTIPDFKAEITQTLENLIDNTQNIFYEDQDTVAKIIENKTVRYLLVKNKKGISVYYESKEFRKKPFQYVDFKEHKIYSPFIFKIFNEKNFEEEVANQFKDVSKEEIKKIIKLLMRETENGLEMTSSLYGLQEFFSIVQPPKSFTQAIEENNEKIDFLLKGHSTNNDKDNELIVFQLTRLYEGALKNKFTSKNKYEFNDLDNHVWIEKKHLCFSCQNFVFVAEKKEKAWSVYVSPLDGDILKENIKYTEIIKKIENNTIDDIKNTVFKIENNQLIFSDPYVFDNSLFYLNASLQSLEDEKMIERELPVNQKLMSPQEYVISSIHQYPNLFLKYSFEQSKLAVFDHIFNVIGSGSDDFERMITGKPFDFSTVEAWFGDQKVYERENKKAKDRIVFEETKDAYEIRKNKDEFLVPYPNFEKSYSLVYSENYKIMSPEWKQAALEFYTYAKEFFKDKEKYQFYHYTFEIEFFKKPEKSNPNYRKLLSSYNENKRNIADLKERFASMTEKQISKDYGVEFKGDKTNEKDIALFLENRWFKEKERIEKFLDRTISMIEGDLKKDKKLKI